MRSQQELEQIERDKVEEIKNQERLRQE